MRIALAGNPNSGKTTLYNILTGGSESAGNWAGVTVTKRESELKGPFGTGSKPITVVDLPGAYSLSPYTQDEEIARDEVLQENLDAIINVVDGANFERSLYLTTQLLELGIPVIVAVNKKDTLEKRGDFLDAAHLERELKCPVMLISAASKDGIRPLMEAVVRRTASKAPQASSGFGDPKGVDEEKKRQEYVKRLVFQCHKRGIDRSQIRFSDKLDAVLADKWFGLPIFFLVMWAVYAFSIEGLGGYLSAYSNDVLFGEIIPGSVGAFLGSLSIAPLLQALIIDGAIGGVGAVIGFLPLIMVLFFCLALLEDSGYMARVAVVMDRYFKRIGLSGKSIIPMIVGSGCGIPGVMATRTIEDANERRATIMLTPFVPCGAKLPIIALFSAVFFPESSWVGPSMYVLSVLVIIAGGLLLKRLFLWDSQAPFIMELPEYKIPSLRYAFRQMLRQASGFIYKASTIILLMNTLVWFLQAYGFNLQPVDNQEASMLAVLGGIIAPLLIPLGFAGWQLAAASITGFIAKENVVGTFAVLLAVASEETLMAPGGVMTSLFTPVTAYAFLVFNLFTPPCFAAIGAMNAEMGSRRWLLRALAFQFGIGYALSMAITQLGTLLLYGTPAVGAVPALLISVVGTGSLLFRLKSIDEKRRKLEPLLAEGGR